jgi:hypothetical protein
MENPQTLIQLVVGAIGLLFSFGLLDIKRKLEGLDKIQHIDGMLVQLKELLDRMSVIVTRQEVSENRFQIEIQYLKDRLHNLENRLDELEKTVKA